MRFQRNKTGVMEQQGCLSLGDTTWELTSVLALPPPPPHLHKKWRDRQSTAEGRGKDAGWSSQEASPGSSSEAPPLGGDK